MAKEFLLVDGYNIIHAWDELKELAEDVDALLDTNNMWSIPKKRKPQTIISSVS